LFFFICSLQITRAQDDSSFPFDRACLKYDQANFKVEQTLMDVMTTGDFPQYCVLYSLSKYQVKQKRDEGYFVAGINLDQQHAEATTVFIKTKMSHPQNQVLAGSASGDAQPVGQWAYFVGTEVFTMDNGSEKEFYTFQEKDF
jgi:hypothetical protein